MQLTRNLNDFLRQNIKLIVIHTKHINFNYHYLQDNVASYTCVCELGWTGANCDQNINDCDPNPCLNGAACNVSIRMAGRTLACVGLATKFIFDCTICNNSMLVNPYITYNPLIHLCRFLIRYGAVLKHCIIHFILANNPVLKC